jgi:hypothetical protein
LIGHKKKKHEDLRNASAQLSSVCEFVAGPEDNTTTNFATAEKKCEKPWGLIWPPASTGPEPPGSQQHKLFDPQAKHPKGYSAGKSGFIFLVVSPQEFGFRGIFSILF